MKSHRRFFLLLLGTSFVAPGRGALSVRPDPPPDELYGWAVHHLRQGRWYDRAARQLRDAISQRPDDARFHSALAAALAGGALARSLDALAARAAGRWTQQQFVAWQRAFLVELKETKAATLAALDRAESLTPGTPAVAHLRVWGLMALLQAESEPMGAQALTPDAEKALRAALKDLLTRAPEDAGAWQTAGDVERELALRVTMAGTLDSADTPPSSQALAPAARERYAGAIARDRRSVAHYRLFEDKVDQGNWAGALHHVEALRIAFPQQTLVDYLAAYLRFQQADALQASDIGQAMRLRQLAVRDLEAGNYRPSLRLRLYQPAYSPLLAPVLQRRQVEQGHDLRVLAFFRQLARQARSYAQHQDISGRPADAEVACRAVVRMAERLWQEEVPIDAGMLQAEAAQRQLTAIAVLAIGARGLKEHFDWIGNLDGVAEAESYQARATMLRQQAVLAWLRLQQN